MFLLEAKCTVASTRYFVLLRLLRPNRHIVTNHLLHFLALDRSDPKKFQILQLIAALLGWTDGRLTRALLLER